MNEEFIDPALIEAYRQQPPIAAGEHAGSHRVDNAMQVALMPLILKANGVAEKDIMGHHKVHWALYKHAQSIPAVAQLFTTRILKGFQAYHNSFQNEVWPVKRVPATGQPISKDKTKLVYSFIYHMIDPNYTFEGEPYGKNLRGSIERLFKGLDLGDVLTAEEVFQNSKQLVAITELMTRQRA